MSQAPPRLLSGAELKALSQRSDLHGALRLGLHLALILGAGWLVAASGPWTLLPAMLLLGVTQAALFAPIHETMHLTAFASRRANAVVGWLAACPSLLNWHFYMAFHLAHHRHTQDPEKDPELIMAPPSSLDAYLWRVIALPYWRTRLLTLRDAWRGDLSAHPYIPARAAPKIIRSMRAMTVFVLGCAGLSMLLVGWWAPLVFWIGPQLLGQPVLRLYLLTEHTLCTHDANGLTNTRTTLTNAAVRLLMWNMSYHTEHHLYPSIPFHRLPAAHGALRDRLAVLQDGYWRWHAGFIRLLRQS
ncbi:fatty acid desaturase [Roseomonas sp. USHLN139]|uniref:fatty acid desaturase n=1 Tax=Roseomonas sp. USHLN139 TaxID=3081298 RepID=UPI003B021CAB